MPISGEFLKYVLEQLSTVRGVTARRMFGGVGLYGEGVFFGLIANDVVYFRVSDENRAAYEARGMRPFRPFPDKPHVSMSYFEVPAEVLEDGEVCAAWAVQSLAAARVKAGKRRERPPKRAARGAAGGAARGR
jgi:DNA transformation protein